MGGTLVVVSRYTFYYYCVFVVIFLIAVYAMVGTFMAALTGDMNKSDANDAAGAGVMICGVFTVLATFGLCLAYYFYTVTVKYAAFKVKEESGSTWKDSSTNTNESY